LSSNQLILVNAISAFREAAHHAVSRIRRKGNSPQVRFQIADDAKKSSDCGKVNTLSTPSRQPLKSGRALAPSKLPRPQYFARVPQLGWRAAKKIVAAHRTTPLADEGLIPLSELPLETGVIVPPDRNKKENERERSDYKVDLYRK